MNVRGAQKNNLINTNKHLSIMKTTYILLLITILLTFAGLLLTNIYLIGYAELTMLIMVSRIIYAKSIK